MTSPAFVDVPGLNFDWLNLDTEQDLRIQPGRRGLTLEQINLLSYGVDALRALLTNASHFGLGLDIVVLSGVTLLFLVIGGYSFSKIEI